MKLYDANAGNPKRVRIFIAEKCLEVPRVVLELGTDTRAPEFLKVNPLGEVPALELDDGQVITETLAICRYLEAAFPERPLMGGSAAEQGNIAMWSQRIHSHIFMTLGLIVRHEVPLFSDVVDQIPAFAQSLRKAVPDKWHWLEEQMSDGRNYIAGDEFTFADVEGMAALMIADAFDLGPPKNHNHTVRWADSMRGRASWAA